MCSCLSQSLRKIRWAKSPNFTGFSLYTKTLKIREIRVIREIRDSDNKDF
jgi:hypothetical protein